MTEQQDTRPHPHHQPAGNPRAGEPGAPEPISEEQMVREQLEYEALRDERDRLVTEAHWFVVAFAASVCLCFLVYVVL